jgi:uncharacterized membrane protein YhaH (DUF805 family)
MEYLNGKSNRSEYAKIVLGAIAVSITLSHMVTAASQDAGAVVTGLLMLMVIPLVLVLGVRRLNDLNRSRWWILLSFVPVFNAAMFLAFLFRAGNSSSSS